jgi:hypothetical protein
MTGSAPPQLGRPMLHRGSGDGNDFGSPRIRLPTVDCCVGGRTVGPTVAGTSSIGASAPLKELQKKFGFEPDRVVAVAKELLGRK